MATISAIMKIILYADGRAITTESVRRCRSFTFIEQGTPRLLRRHGAPALMRCVCAEFLRQDALISVDTPEVHQALAGLR